MSHNPREAPAIPARRSARPGQRHDLWRWGSAGTATACDASRGGTWTPAGSGFALRWPTSVPAGAAGACITQIGNLSCSRADADTCLLHDASCERAFNLSGHRADLCRWHNDHSVATCATTDGIWTAAGSPFAIEWPTSVPSFASGACVPQVGTL